MPIHSNRRRFLRQSLRGLALLPIAGPLLSSCGTPSENAQSDPQSQSVPRSGKSLNILILGGTSFLGPHQIAYALERGHTITTFTRGKTKPTVHADLFEQVESLVGDRADNLSALEGRKWDAVIDTVEGRSVLLKATG
ncbi:MAG: NAD-dependent epimerase/dehydratase family protein, partial [Bacteroidota bacterium]